jgi:glycine/D-amino acid oxidase-like deaminating enzyme
MAREGRAGGTSEGGRASGGGGASGAGGTPIPADLGAARAGRRSDLIVIGAGVMGSWIAYWAQVGGGRRVTLLDAWGAGHPRATSGDETRISRAAHGDDRLYTRWSRRSRDHWLRFQEEWETALWVPCGCLWFAHREDAFEARSAVVLQAEGVPHERLDPDELARRWPQLRLADGVRFALYEPEGGALMARRGCRATTSAFQRAGGTYAIAGVRPGSTDRGRLTDVVDVNGGRWQADTFVFAAGPWLPRLFPDVLGDAIRVTKQDVLYFGAPAGDMRFDATAMPAWADYDAAYWGIGSVEGRGFKVGPDRIWPIFDPSNGERVVDPESVRLARAYLRRRFPNLADAPVVETRVCQYESTIDAHFLVDRHPEWENVWLVGGGSGHGYKHGPRMGEYVVARLDGAQEADQDGPDEARFRIGPRVRGSAARTGGDAMATTWDLF